MGTSLTEEQGKELDRHVRVAKLCLDADAAGQEAALRAVASLPRRFDLQVVALPKGSDPADIVGQPGGAERMQVLLDSAVPFAMFRVQRALDRADSTDAAGRDKLLEEVAGTIRPITEAILRDQLVRMVAGGLAITPELVNSVVMTANKTGGAAMKPSGGGTVTVERTARQALDRREQSERAFLALCVALPELGETKLAEADLDTLFTSPLTRLAAERLRGHLTSPSSVLADAPELAQLIPEIVLRAGQLDATPATLELEALQLDLHRLDREITAARTGTAQAEIGPLAAERQKVLDAIRHRLQ
jgi:DNA primase